MKFLDPTNDLAFKKIFGNEKKKNILISFLNAILGFEGEHQIEEVEILNPYQAPKIEELKETILDIRAKDRSGSQFIVEMQKNDKGDFHKRSQYYTAKAYTAQLESGFNYSSLQKVYFIGILNFNIFEGENYLSRHLILNEKTLKQELSDFEFNFVELKKFTKELNELASLADKWIYFLKNAKSLDLIPSELEKTTELKEAFEIANSFGWNKKEMEIYDYMRLKEMDAENEIKTAEKKGLQKGLQKGKQEGKQEGLIEGEKIGLQKALQKLITSGLSEEQARKILEL